ncbi:MAG TPA: c-type cytochrome [Steroidobacteraceae bacterium]|nr:c-type cytochrome [Steroidobacteraceae bacterium]
MSSIAIFLGAVVLAVAAPVHAEEGDPEAGADLYNSVCKACHAVNIGPTLRGVVGRRIASVEAFTGYSDALKALQDKTWTPELLDTFLQGPGELAPGTLMTQVVPDAQTRADLIAYLATLTPR